MLQEVIDRGFINELSGKIQAVLVAIEHGKRIDSVRLNHAIPKKMAKHVWGLPVQFGSKKLKGDEASTATKFIYEEVQPCLVEHCRTISPQLNVGTRQFIFERRTVGAYFAEVT